MSRILLKKIYLYGTEKKHFIEKPHYLVCFFLPAIYLVVDFLSKDMLVFSYYRLYFARIDSSSAAACAGADVKRLTMIVRNKEIKKAGTR